MGCAASSQRSNRSTALEFVHVPLPQTAQEFECFGDSNVITALRFLVDVARAADAAGAKRIPVPTGLVEASIQASEAAIRSSHVHGTPVPPPPAALRPPYVLTDPTDPRTQVVILDPGAEAVYLARRLGKTRTGAKASSSSGSSAAAQRHRPECGSEQWWDAYRKRQFALLYMHSDLFHAHHRRDGKPRFLGTVSMRAVEVATQVSSAVVGQAPTAGGSHVVPSLTIAQVNTLTKHFRKLDTHHLGMVCNFCGVAVHVCGVRCTVLACHPFGVCSLLLLAVA